MPDNRNTDNVVEHPWLDVEDWAGFAFLMVIITVTFLSTVEIKLTETRFTLARIGSLVIALPRYGPSLRSPSFLAVPW